MAKKLLIILAVAFVLIGGFFGVKQYMDYQAHQAYLKSPNKVADELVAYLRAGNAKGAYTIFADTFKADYSEAYWEKQFFPQLKGANITAPKTVEQIKQQAGQPPAYPVGVEAWRFTYQFTLHDVDYVLTTIIAKKDNGSWLVHGLTGAYKAAQ